LEEQLVLPNNTKHQGERNLDIQNNVKSFINELVSEAVQQDIENEIVILRSEIAEIGEILKNLNPVDEESLLAFTTLVDVQADYLKRVASLYKQSFVKGNSVEVIGEAG